MTISDGSNEEWRPVPGYEGFYDVSSFGRVRSWHRTSGQVPRILKTDAVDYHGYRRACLNSPGRKQATPKVSRLMALAFLGPIPPGQVVRHLDDVRTNDMLSNLALGTHADNAADKMRNGHHWSVNQTHCTKGHEFTPENTTRRKAEPAWRRCRTCDAKSKAARRSCSSRSRFGNCSRRRRHLGPHAVPIGDGMVFGYTCTRGRNRAVPIGYGRLVGDSFEPIAAALTGRALDGDR